MGGMRLRRFAVSLGFLYCIGSHEIIQKVMCIAFMNEIHTTQSAIFGNLGENQCTFRLPLLFYECSLAKRVNEELNNPHYCPSIWSLLPRKVPFLSTLVMR